MGYFSGNITARGNMAKRMVVTSSNIINSTLDMNMKTITGVQDPVEPQDAATRFYVDTTVQKVEDEFQSFFSGIVVSLIGVDFAEIGHIKPGSYVVTVTPYHDGFPTATFSISKASEYSVGHVMRITAQAGIYTPESLELMWPQGGVLKMRKNGPGYDGDYLVDLNVKNLSSLPGPPVLETDQASKAYVDKVVREQLDFKFGGVTVHLEGTAFVDIVNLRLGSYFISVSPLSLDGAPTATFSVSKNSMSEDATITPLTQCLGLETLEELELQWSANSKPKLRKTGMGYDGGYIVDMNLRNFTYDFPALPEDVATMEFVEQQIENKMKIKFGGIMVYLEGIEISEIVSLRFGSYMITVSSINEGGPTGTFLVSKALDDRDASIENVTWCPGDNTGEILTLTWPSNSKLLLQKSGPFHDGQYLVDFNLKNFTNIPPPLLPSEVASKLYVEQMVNEAILARNDLLKRISIVLTGSTAVPVVALLPGSYVLTISPQESGGPTATFALSKSSPEMEPMIIRMSGCLGRDGNENLTILWPPNDKVFIKKTGDNFDGVYFVDTSARNSVVDTEATLPPVPRIPGIKFGQVLQYEFYLQGKQEVGVAFIEPGSYFAFICSQEVGLYNATFSLIKPSETNVPGFTVPMNLSRTYTGYLPPDDTPITDFLLNLRWGENNTLYIAKTIETNDGIYILKLM
jgi:hypothetical protein